MKRLVPILALASLLLLSCHKAVPQEPGVTVAIPVEVHDRIKTLADSLAIGSKREYIEREERAWADLQEYKAEGVPPEVIIAKKAELAELYPDHFAGQLNILEKQIADYAYVEGLQDGRVPTEILADIRDKVRREYPTDFSARRTALDMQIENWLLMRVVK